MNKPLNDYSHPLERKPKEQTYAGHDCTTYGKCPRCGAQVFDSIGKKSDSRCEECGLLLNWE